MKHHTWLIAALLLTGCAANHSKPKRFPEPILFRHCAVVQEPDGKQGCDCLTPLIVDELDAATKKYRRVAYCDGKAQ